MSRQEHGTIASYILGFILSLIFTLIPYYLVVNHRIGGNALLATILAFAVAQLIIQVTFFLHLGRGPKPNWNLFFFVSTVGIIVVVVGGSILIISNLHYNMQPSEQTKKLINDEGIYQLNGELTGACQEIQTNYQIVIEDGNVSPVRTDAKKCDTLTFINKGSSTVKISFGTYPEHQSYAGENDLSVRRGQTETITLSESGSYNFYNELQPETTGAFNVAE
jgi:cytochrome o ubiquinol oxidase operon protein cyoD